MVEPQISVIVPVYNTEKYLHRCIDSILVQTYTNFELLLIDDGSIDSSGAICNEYAEKDSRVRVFHKVNGGVSSARNMGLDNARGRWIAFVDADDYVKSSYLQVLFDDAIRKSADFVIQDFEFIAENGLPIERWYNVSIKTYRRGELLHIFEEQQLEKRCYSFSKLFSSEVIKTHGIRYPLNVRFGEDACFVFRYLKNVSNVSCSNVANYYYIDHPGSAIHRKFDFSVEYEGYKSIRDAVMNFAEGYKTDEYYDNNVMSWVAYFMHRAITVAQYKKELYTFTTDDWRFFNTYFVIITRKTALDKWMISHFYKKPSILLPYLKFNRSLSNFLAKKNLWTLLDKLKQ